MSVLRCRYKKRRHGCLALVSLLREGSLASPALSVTAGSDFDAALFLIGYVNVVPVLDEETITIIITVISGIGASAPAGHPGAPGARVRSRGRAIIPVS